EIQVETDGARYSLVVRFQGTGDGKICVSVAVEISHADESYVEGLLLEGNGEVRLRRVMAAGLSPVNRDVLSATEVDEIGAAIAVEIARELSHALELDVI